MQALVDEFRAPGAAAALPGLLADFAADPELKARIRGDFLAPAKARLALVFERAAARGEITDDTPVDLVLDMLAGAVFSTSAWSTSLWRTTRRRPAWRPGSWLRTSSAYAIVFLVVTLSVGWPRPLLRLPQWMLFLPVCALTVAGTV
ncbi:TetR-like C-terminal domain-containing protein [Streptomyces sp. NPDC059816]|uniref:TetR-like C-terminal domain-containing protein n=1 Tax=Streptomyces sp. NPDC059816 TaxID=3346960 RepID=UPI00364631F3